MKHYESYVAEAQARRRQRATKGIVGAVMLAALALWTLMAFNTQAEADNPPASHTSALGADQAPDSNATHSMPNGVHDESHAAARHSAARYR